MLNGLTSTNTINFDNTSFAPFGKLNRQPVDGFHVQPGLRLNYDKKSGFDEAGVSIRNAREQVCRHGGQCRRPTRERHG